MYGFPRWRLFRILEELVTLCARHGEGFDLDNTHLMSLKICPYHIEGANDAEKNEIRQNQKKCGNNPEPDYFVNGYCSRYRYATGHCDMHSWKKKEDK